MKKEQLKIKNEKQRLEINKGITLIALIITIVILIIIAGVTINLSVGENGIFNKAKYAKEEYSNSAAYEQEKLNELYSQLFVATNDDAQITISVKDLNNLIQQKVEESNKSTLEEISKLNARVAQIEENGVSAVSLERIDTLTSPKQLTHAGYYLFAACDETINANVAENKTFSDYAIGDFKGILLSANVSSDKGCRYGTLIITSPRFKNYIWIVQIWDYNFNRFTKIEV